MADGELVSGGGMKKAPGGALSDFAYDHVSNARLGQVRW